MASARLAAADGGTPHSERCCDAIKTTCWALLCCALAACAATSSTQPASAAVEPIAQPQHSYERSFEGPGISLRLSLAALPNLLYHLDCLSEAVFCSSQGYRTLWASLGLTADDEAALARWKSLRTRHTGTFRADAETAAAALLLPGALIDLAERQRIAALRAENLDDFEAAFALLTNDADAHELREIATRFEARFQQYWRSKGLAAGAAYFADMSQLLGDQFLLDTLARVARFDGHPSEHGASHEYRFHLLVQPQSDNKGLRAYQLESDFEVEAPEQGKAVDLIDVVAHELCHALLYQMPAQAKLALVDAFVHSDDPYSLVDYGLFDEALATSVGNGLVWRHFHPQGDFERYKARNFLSLYKPAAALAVALFPQLEAVFASDASAASPSFVRTLAEAARASYREHGPTPIDYLHSHVLISTPLLEAAAAKVRDTAFAGFPYLREFKQLDAEAEYYVQQHPQLSAAVYVPSTTALPELFTALGLPQQHSTELRALDHLFQLVPRSRGLVYALRRTPKTFVFFFIARDAASAAELADAFIALPEMREGALIELAQK